MPFTPQLLQTQLDRVEHPRCWWVALSGGLDSTALLQALVQLAPPQPVKALHVNHQLSPNARHWERHCAELCRCLGVPLEVERVRVTPSGKGVEDAAREARYRVFKDCLGEGEALLTGHHADDQVETLLLRLLRGSGPRGLSAMARRRPLGRGELLRPLLDWTRAELRDFAIAEGLTWVEDESNHSEQFDRNYLRRKLLPPLVERWPDYARRWQHSVELCAESEALLEDLAGLDMAAAGVTPEWGGWSLDRHTLQSLTQPRRHNLIRHWLRQLGLAGIGRAQLAEVDAQLLDGREDARARVDWAGLSLRRFGNRLYLLALPEWRGLSERPFNMVDRTRLEIPLPDGGELRLVREDNSDQPRLRADLNDLHLRWRTGGERCHPSGRGHSQSLKKLLQEVRLEPWWRDRLPLLYSGDQMVAAADLWVCRGFVATPGEPGFRLQWCRYGRPRSKF